jgi:hypothetical protein
MSSVSVYPRWVVFSTCYINLMYTGPTISVPSTSTSTGLPPACLCTHLCMYLSFSSCVTEGHTERNLFFGHMVACFDRAAWEHELALRCRVADVKVHSYQWHALRTASLVLQTVNRKRCCRHQRLQLSVPRVWQCYGCPTNNSTDSP